jgi:hypothetical protein
MTEQAQSLEPVLALHERDRAAGLKNPPWPPAYPKQPDERPRVAPSARGETLGNPESERVDFVVCRSTCM